MKYPVDITLKTIHVGSVQRVVTLGINGKDHASEFLEELKKRDAKTFKKLATRVRVVAEQHSYENEN